MNRWVVRKQAWVALLAFVASLSLPLVASKHLAFDDDTACEPDVFAAHRADTQPTHYETVRPVTPTTHCALCHWLRAVGGAQPNSAVADVAWFEPAAVVTVVPVQWHASTRITDRPSRAPPARLG